MGKFAITITNCRATVREAVGCRILTPSGDAEVFDDDASYSCTGAGNAAERRA